MNAVAGTTQSGFDVAIEMNDRDPLLAPEELSRILELVADASPGPWDSRELANCEYAWGARVAKADAEYVAYLHPGRVVLMVGEIERLRLALARAEAG